MIKLGPEFCALCLSCTAWANTAIPDPLSFSEIESVLSPSVLSPFTHCSPGSLLHFPSSLILFLTLSFLLLSFPLLSSFFLDIPSSFFVLLLISSAVVASLHNLLSSPLFFLFFSFLHLSSPLSYACIALLFSPLIFLTVFASLLLSNPLIP